MASADGTCLTPHWRQVSSKVIGPANRGGLVIGAPLCRYLIIDNCTEKMTSLDGPPSLDRLRLSGIDILLDPALCQQGRQGLVERRCRRSRGHHEEQLALRD